MVGFIKTALLTFQSCFQNFIEKKKSGVPNCIETLLVFVRKGIQNLKWYVATVKSLDRKRVCSSYSGRNTLNQNV